MYRREEINDSLSLSVSSQHTTANLALRFEIKAKTKKSALVEGLIVELLVFNRHLLIPDLKVLNSVSVKLCPLLVKDETHIHESKLDYCYLCMSRKHLQFSLFLDKKVLISVLVKSCSLIKSFSYIIYIVFHPSIHPSRFFLLQPLH